MVSGVRLVVGCKRSGLLMRPRDRWICTYKCALRVWPEPMATAIRKGLRCALGHATPLFPDVDRGAISPHCAAFDAVVTAAIFEELIKLARWADVVQVRGTCLANADSFGEGSSQLLLRPCRYRDASYPMDRR